MIISIPIKPKPYERQELRQRVDVTLNEITVKLERLEGKGRGVEVRCGHEEVICSHCGRVNEVEADTFKVTVKSWLFTPPNYAAYKDEIRKYLLSTPGVRKFEKGNKLKMDFKFLNPHVLTDLSNLVKAVEDAGQGILYDNDNQIKREASEIVYSRMENPLVMFEVMPL